MKIAETSIRRPVLASMVILTLVVFGITAYRGIGVDLFPDVDFPVVTITVRYEGADPETVETDVTDPIEEAVNTIGGVKTLRSESMEGLSQVFVEFELEEDVDVVSQEVRDKVATIRGDLPLEIDPPIIEKFDIDASPIMAIVLAGPASIRDLSERADKKIKPQIEGISGVGNARLVGEREREIRIWLRGDDLRAYQLLPKDVIDALRNENLEPPGGRVETGSREIIVKTMGKFKKVSDFEDLIVASRDGVPIKLRDVAYVEDGLADFRSLARLNGQRAVSLLVRRQSGANLLEVATNVKKRLDDIRATLPEGYELILAQDLSVYVEQSIDEARGELLRGGLLAIIVILLFLRNVRGSLVAAITIPTTIISTFTFMLAMGFTVNMMTMLGLTVCVGMIVDDSIVVLENTYRHMEEGMPRMQAAYKAIAEIGFAVIATSLAIMAVFVPVAFMQGIVGKFFFQFGMTVAFAVAISTFIAVTLSPMLCSRILRVTPQHGRVFNAMERFFKGLESAYRFVLGTALHHRWKVVGIAVLVFVASLSLAGLLGKEFIPQADEDQFNVQVETPVGTSIQASSEALAEVERRLQSLPGVTDTFTTIGGGAEERVNVATVLTQLVPKSQRELGQSDIMALARERLADLAHLKISVEAIPRVSGGGFRNAALQYNLRGPDLKGPDGLAALSEKFIQKIREHQDPDNPQIVDLNSTYDAGKPQLDVDPDREQLAQAGVSVKDLGGSILPLIGGQKAATFEEGGESYDVRLRLAESQRNRPADVLDVPVRTKTGELVELHNLVKETPGTGPVQIDRQDRSRQVTLLGNLAKTKPLGEAIQDLKQIEGEVGLPPGVTTKVTGQGEHMEESFANINFSLMLAVVLIYMVLAGQFESLMHPFTIMLSLPLSIVGALGALALTGKTLNIFSMIGMIMLMGLVTKNAILLVDFTNQLREQGMDKTDALLKAGPIRLRPILMTAVSTIAGMLPVALGLGSGAETRSPMGVCIVGGMITSTILTLVVVPVVYSLLDDGASFLRRLVFRSAAEVPGERLVVDEEKPVLVAGGGNGSGVVTPQPSPAEVTASQNPSNDTMLVGGPESDDTIIERADSHADRPPPASGDGRRQQGTVKSSSTGDGNA